MGAIECRGVHGARNSARRKDGDGTGPAVEGGSRISVAALRGASYLSSACGFRRATSFRRFCGFRTFANRSGSVECVGDRLPDCDGRNLVGRASDINNRVGGGVVHGIIGRGILTSACSSKCHCSSVWSLTIICCYEDSNHMVELRISTGGNTSGTGQKMGGGS